jgi:hypothetical protein
VVPIVYALVACQWIVFHGVCVPLREVTLPLGGFCQSADWVGCTLLGCVVAICLTACARARRLPGQDYSSAVSRGRRVCGPRMAAVWRTRGFLPTGLRGAAALAICMSLFPLCCSATHPGPDPDGKAVNGRIYFCE